MEPQTFLGFPVVGLISRKAHRQSDVPQLLMLQGFSKWIKLSLDTERVEDSIIDREKVLKNTQLFGRNQQE
jgi:hypothetical protein